MQEKGHLRQYGKFNTPNTVPFRIVQCVMCHRPPDGAEIGV